MATSLSKAVCMFSVLFTALRGKYLLDQEVPSTYIQLQHRIEKLRKDIGKEGQQPPVLAVADFR